MHGAMTAEGYPDCEGDLLARVRTIVGPDTVVGAELDLHCSITGAMVDNADALVLFKEYPHTDVGERAAELFDLCVRKHRGEIDPVMAVHDCRMINMWRTPTETDEDAGGGDAGRGREGRCPLGLLRPWLSVAGRARHGPRRCW